MSKYINTGHSWALTPEAKSYFDRLITEGVDPDLAIAILENEIPEEDLYEIEDEDEDNE